jgi:hypothetical protein
MPSGLARLARMRPGVRLAVGLVLAAIGGVALVTGVGTRKAGQIALVVLGVMLAVSGIVGLARR